MQPEVNTFKIANSIRSPEVSDAIEELATQDRVEAHGAVFTRAEVVDFILDLIGYTEDQPLYEKRLLEPSFGDGAFLLRAVGRLLNSWVSSKNSESVVDGLGNAIRAVELHRATYTSTRMLVLSQLEKAGLSAESATTLVNQWLLQDDFLLTPLEGPFHYVASNPPYVRQELIHKSLLVEYRNLYHTMYDRADLYVPFIERSLQMLGEGGSLGVICADRWMKSRYGGSLRNFIAENFHLKVHVDMVDTLSFQRNVSAYPAITIISSEKPGTTRIAHRPPIHRPTLTALAQKLRAEELPKKNGMVRELNQVTDGMNPWLLESPAQIALIRRLEQQFPTLEEANCKVGIGVATGADSAFIGDFETLDVEPDRKLPLVTNRDIVSGEVCWGGKGVINPFKDDGSLVYLDKHPRLRKYLEVRKDVIAARHCARKTPSRWYRTIDRISPTLLSKPKLLIPDIKKQANVVFEPGNLYPHHNLYYVTSDTWDLKALQAVLLSDISTLFVEMYTTKISGGFLRFQAQHLRRIRLPHWHDVSENLRQDLITAATQRDLKACNKAASELYSLNQEEQLTLR